MRLGSGVCTQRETVLEGILQVGVLEVFLGCCGVGLEEYDPRTGCLLCAFVKYWSPIIDFAMVKSMGLCCAALHGRGIQGYLPS